MTAEAPITGTQVAKKILFLAEAVTWSQVVRLLALANGLGESFDISFAAARFDPRLFGQSDFARHAIHSLSPAQIDARLKSGGRIYDHATLARYVEEELALFEKVQPDLVVSDLRWSTAISAPVAGVKLATLIDGYWFRDDAQFPIPDHLAVRLLGVETVRKGFARALPHVLRHFAGPVNRLRRAHGLSQFAELRDVLAFGDALLFPDHPALVPSNRAGEYLGPILWAPEEPLPEYWEQLGASRPLVYVTMGSSGPVAAIPKILDALSTLDVDVLLSTAGRLDSHFQSKQVRVVAAIRGDLAARRASLVVCSGGASTGWQALAEGAPIVGIPSNLDASLAMSCIESAGAGIALRPSATVPELRAAIARALRDESLRASARGIARSFAALDPHPRFRAVVDRLTADSGSS